MREWLSPLAKLKREVPDEVLVLPSHNECFYGLHARLDYLAAAQAASLDRLPHFAGAASRHRRVCGAVRRGIDESDTGLLNLATGESLACLNYLWHRGRSTASSTRPVWLVPDGVSVRL